MCIRYSFIYLKVDTVWGYYGYRSGRPIPDRYGDFGNLLGTQVAHQVLDVYKRQLFGYGVMRTVIEDNAVLQNLANGSPFVSHGCLRCV